MYYEKFSHILPMNSLVIGLKAVNQLVECSLYPVHSSAENPSRVNVKVKVRTLVMAPLSRKPPQKRWGMVRVVRVFTILPAHPRVYSRTEWTVPLPSHPKLVLIRVYINLFNQLIINFSPTSMAHKLEDLWQAQHIMWPSRTKAQTDGTDRLTYEAFVCRRVAA